MSYGTKGGGKCSTGADALADAYRPSKSDIGKVVRPPAAPGPESKGKIAPVKQVGDSRK